MTTATHCPHCGKPLRHNGIQQHQKVCVRRPGVRELVRRLLERPDAPGDALSSREYTARAMEHNAQPGIGLRAPSQRALDDAFGGWRAVCEWAELRYTRKPQSDDADEAAAIAEVVAALCADAALRAEWDDHGLPVSRVRKLPRGVAYELR